MGGSRKKSLAHRLRRRRRAKRGPLALTAPRGPLAPLVATARRARRAPVRRTSKRVRRPSWKLLGLAGLAGVAATGVAVARHRRAQVDLPPDELRRRLHERLEQVGQEPAAQAPAPRV